MVYCVDSNSVYGVIYVGSYEDCSDYIDIVARGGTDIPEEVWISSEIVLA